VIPSAAIGDGAGVRSARQTASAVAVWRFAVSREAAEVATELVSEDERARAGRLRDFEAQWASLIAWAGVRALLAESMHVPALAFAFERRCRYCSGDHGKPYAIDPGGCPRFSLSHTRGMVLVSVSEHFDVGIDVEHLTTVDDWQRIARIALSDEVNARLGTALSGGLANAHVAFLSEWVRAEARAKLTGSGLAGMARPARGAYVRDLHVGRRYVAALATPSRCSVVLCDGDLTRLKVRR
jgi:4'-phosphopantetheinyl transferase